MAPPGPAIIPLPDIFQSVQLRCRAHQTHNIPRALRTLATATTTPPRQATATTAPPTGRRAGSHTSHCQTRALCYDLRHCLSATGHNHACTSELLGRSVSTKYLLAVFTATIALLTICVFTLSECKNETRIVHQLSSKTPPSKIT